MPIQILPWLYLSDEYHALFTTSTANSSSSSSSSSIASLGVTHILSLNKGPSPSSPSPNTTPAASCSQIQERSSSSSSSSSLLLLATNQSNDVGIVQHNHKAIAAKDTNDYDLIGRHWEDEAKPFLLEAKNSGGKVVVHCGAGTNRSGLIAAAAMLLLDDHNDDNNKEQQEQQQQQQQPERFLLDIVKDLKQKRGMVLTNVSFQQQLCELAAKYNKLGPMPKGYSNEEAPRRSKLKQQHRQTGNFESMFQ